MAKSFHNLRSKMPIKAQKAAHEKAQVIFTKMNLHKLHQVKHKRQRQLAS